MQTQSPEPAGGSSAAHPCGPLAGKRRWATMRLIEGLARWTRYVESEISGLRQLVHRGSVCIDIGAAAGLYTAALSELAGPEGQVHSVEPLSFAHRHLRRVLDARESNVRRHALALGAAVGSATMAVPMGRFGMVTGRAFLDLLTGGPDPNAEFSGHVTVPVAVDTLDALCSREAIQDLDFVKIDVEGAELQVLGGGEEVIDVFKPTMLIEIEARHTARYRRCPEDVTTWLFERGYRMYTWHGGWHLSHAVTPEARNYLFTHG